MTCPYTSVASVHISGKKSRETVVLCPSEQWLVVTEVETQTSIKVGGDFMDTKSRRFMKHYLPYTSIPFKEIHLIKHPWNLAIGEWESQLNWVAGPYISSRWSNKLTPWTRTLLKCVVVFSLKHAFHRKFHFCHQENQNSFLPLSHSSDIGEGAKFN